MKLVKIALVTVVVLAAVGYGGYAVYGIGYSGGEQAGYDSGYTVGQQAGYGEGQADGYSEGYLSGEQAGYSEGYLSGEHAGYDDGYLIGKQDGYVGGYASGKREGHDEGYETGRTAGYEQGVEDGLGHGYTIKDSTYDGVLAFLAQDKTDESEYVADFYVCSHFARDVCNNAEEAGIRCAFVELRYSGQGHTIVAFDTIDMGLVYFEPQSDERVNPEIGLRYYQTVVPEPGYYYEPPDYDDTILDILAIW